MEQIIYKNCGNEIRSRMTLAVVNAIILCNCVRSLKKIWDFNRIWTRDLTIPERCSNHLSYEATDVKSWSRVQIPRTELTGLSECMSHIFCQLVIKDLGFWAWDPLNPTTAIQLTTEFLLVNWKNCEAITMICWMLQSLPSPKALSHRKWWRKRTRHLRCTYTSANSMQELISICIHSLE